VSSLSSFPRAQLGELRKAIAPTIGVIFVIAIGVCWAAISFSASFLQEQADVLPNTAAMSESVDQSCIDNPNDSSDVCEASRIQAASTETFAANTQRLGEIGQSYDTAPGLLRYVSHQWATTLGWIVVALIAAFHVASEWATRSAGLTAHANGSRARFVATKIVSTWLIALATLAATTVALFALRPLFTTNGTITNSTGDGTVQLATDSTWSSWSGALAHFAIAAGVLLAVSTVAVAVAMISKRAILTVGAVIVMTAGVYLAGSSQFSPSEAIAGWMDFDEVNGGIVGDSVLWVYSGSQANLATPPTNITTSPAFVVLYVALVAAIAAAASVIVSRRRAL
jgi:hypothetical protein